MELVGRMIDVTITAARANSLRGRFYRLPGPSGLNEVPLKRR